MVKIEGDALVLEELGEYNGRVLKALVRAMNRALGTGRTYMARAVASDTGIKQSDVRAAMSTREATFNRIEASIGAGLKRLPLSKFNARGPEPSKGTGRGVTWRIGQRTGRGPNLFLATMKSGHRGVFARVGADRKSRGAWGKNLPIDERYGPSLGRVFGFYRPVALSLMKQSFDKNFDHEMDYRNRKPTVTVQETGLA